MKKETKQSLYLLGILIGLLIELSSIPIMLVYGGGEIVWFLTMMIGGGIAGSCCIVAMDDLNKEK